MISLMLGQETICQASKNPKDSQRYGGRLILGTSNPPTVFNPILTNRGVSATLLDLIFDALIRMDDNERVVGGIAKSWEISEDQLVYTFFLHKNVFFHDGVELTADDVKFTYDAVMNPAYESPRKVDTDFMDRWEVVDRYTIKLYLKKPFSRTLHKLYREIAPKHLLEGVDLEKAPFNQAPVGTGPFIFHSWDRETDQIILRANTIYFDGRPYISEVEVKTYQDIDQLWAAFMRQEIDLGKYLSRKDFLVLEKDKTFRTFKVPSDSYYAIAYNLEDPMMKELPVRQAIAYAIHVNDIIQQVFGEGIRSHGPFHPGVLKSNRMTRIFEYNPDMAIQLLEENGWIDEDDDSIREKQDQELEIDMIVYARSDINVQMATLIRQQLSEVGIKVHLKLYEDLSTLDNEELDIWKSQAWLRLFRGSGIQDVLPEEVLKYWYSPSEEYAKIWVYQNPVVDQLFEKAQNTIDPEERRNIFQDMHHIIYEEQSVGFLFFPVNYHATSSRIWNTESYFTNSMPRYTMKEWYISEN